MSRPSQLTAAKRRRLLTRALLSAVKPLGFSHHAGPYFSRSRGDIVDAFFFQISRSQFRFCIAYGVSVPSLLPQIYESEILNPEPQFPSLTLSRWLNRQEDFGCKYEDHIHNSEMKVRDRFESEAEPWFTTFKTPHDISREYHRTEVRTKTPVRSEADRSVVRWTVYGLMLHNLGKTNAAHEWLDAAGDAWSNRNSKNSAEWLRIISTVVQGS